MLIEPAISVDLKRHAYKKLSMFELKYSKDFLNERLSSKSKEHGRNFEYYKKEISEFPNGIIIMTHEKRGQNFKKLLDVFQEIVQPSAKTINYLKRIFENAKVLEEFDNE